MKMNWIIQQFLLTEFRFDTKLIGKNGNEISANVVVVIQKDRQYNQGTMRLTRRDFPIGFVVGLEIR